MKPAIVESQWIAVVSWPHIRPRLQIPPGVHVQWDLSVLPTLPPDLDLAASFHTLAAPTQRAERSPSQRACLLASRPGGLPVPAAAGDEPPLRPGRRPRRCSGHPPPGARHLLLVTGTFCLSIRAPPAAPRAAPRTGFARPATGNHLAPGRAAAPPPGAPPRDRAHAVSPPGSRIYRGYLSL